MAEANQNFTLADNTPIVAGNMAYYYDDEKNIIEGYEITEFSCGYISLRRIVMSEKDFSPVTQTHSMHWQHLFSTISGAIRAEIAEIDRQMEVIEHKAEKLKSKKRNLEVLANPL